MDNIFFDQEEQKILSDNILHYVLLGFNMS